MDAGANNLLKDKLGLDRRSSSMRRALIFWHARLHQEQIEEANNHVCGTMTIEGRLT